jgi:hypothetical protein
MKVERIKSPVVITLEDREAAILSRIVWQITAYGTGGDVPDLINALRAELNNLGVEQDLRFRLKEAEIIYKSGPM